MVFKEGKAEGTSCTFIYRVVLKRNCSTYKEIAAIKLVITHFYAPQFMKKSGHRMQAFINCRTL